MTAPGSPSNMSPQHPAPNAVLIGTAETILALRAAMVTVPDAPEPVGCLLTADGSADCIAGIPVWGSIENLAAAHEQHRFEQVVITLPASHAPDLAAARAAVAELGLAERVVPPLGELLSKPPTSAGLALTGVSVGGAHTSTGVRVDPARLIGRDPVDSETAAVGSALSGKRVLITGAGGSIGSELALQCAAMGPAELILMERSENALFEIDRKLRGRHPALERRSLLHDVVDERATRRQLERLRPDAVYHAAAHKHVPLMEDHPSHAVDNNVFGTRSIAEAAAASGAERFVLISSDKAVNPSSVMGATKLLAERCVRALAPAWDATRFSMVRFGNVLGSAGSVVPIWTAQLAEGGPVTVTDERMTRFFMTIPEAASLVLQASVLEQTPGEAALYELDMGDPVSIFKMAERFCSLHGFTPFVGEQPAEAPSPVEIVLTGIRPGEKLHEELAYGAEQVEPTAAAGVLRWRGDELAVSLAELAADLEPARGRGAEMDAAEVIRRIRRWAPEFRQPDLDGVRMGSPEQSALPAA